MKHWANACHLTNIYRQWLPRPGLVTAECVLDLLCQDLTGISSRLRKNLKPAFLSGAPIPGQWPSPSWREGHLVTGGHLCHLWAWEYTSSSLEVWWNNIVTCHLKLTVSSVLCHYSRVLTLLILMSPVTGVHSNLETSQQVTTCIRSHSPHPRVHQPSPLPQYSLFCSDFLPVSSLLPGPGRVPTGLVWSPPVDHSLPRAPDLWLVPPAPVLAPHWSSLTLTVLAWYWPDSLHPGLALVRYGCTQVNWVVGSRVTLHSETLYIYENLYHISGKGTVIVSIE